MKPNPVRVARFLAALALSALVATPAGAGKTDIATIPLVNASASTVLPNIWFILDDSGSMNWRTLPGGVNEFEFIPRVTDYWASAHCNGLGYNPNETYSHPPNQGTTNYVDASFNSAWNDGYAGGAQTDLTDSIYFAYKGAEPSLNFAYDVANAVVANNFYNECNTSRATITAAAGGKTCQVTSIKVGLTEILSGVSAWTNDAVTMASSIADKISAAGYAARVNPSNTKQVLIYSEKVADGNVAPVVTSACLAGGGGVMTYAVAKFPAAGAGSGQGLFTPVKLTAASPAATKTNYANWYSYYRIRINMAKSSIGAAFADIRGTPVSFATDPTDGDFFHARIGFTSLHDNSGLGDLALGAFDSGANSQKVKFFDRLYGATPSGATPLKTALKAAGQMYKRLPANGAPATSAPIQYYCQRNNTIATTDGYWNDSPAPGGIGNQDNLAKAARPQYEGPVATSDTLADIAMYYYNTDLRPDMAGQLPAPKASADLQIDDVQRNQHMVTFGVGMGVDGMLKYASDYKTTTDVNSDFYKIRFGGKDWPSPGDNLPAAVDDLWHAAVNGRGTYFSAKTPRALSANLKTALSQMDVVSGSGSSSGGGNLNPTSGTDYGYKASYETAQWTGDLTAYPYTATATLSPVATWSAATELKSKIAANGKSDTRTIYTGKTKGLLDAADEFLPANISVPDQAYFNNNQLHQFVDEWTPVQKTAGTWQNMVNYLRGQNEYEVKSTATAQLYRSRLGVLGDIVHSQPVYVGKPSFNFLDAGYPKFKTDNVARIGARATVYVGANDGMLHAFNANTGSERWAYVPPMVYSNLWRLADRDYGTNHRYYVDGPIAVSDAFFNGDWHTVLVSGLGAGGRGYFALDITEENAPKLLWTFSADDDANVGYTFGTPLIVKSGDKWVAVLASGYNNVPEGGNYATADGKGYVFVLDLADGTAIKKIGTGVGTVATPSGLATLNVEVKSSADYTARKAYGGDLTGTMYRFDLGAGTASTLIALGNLQPITSAPEVARPNGPSSAPLVYFGTGRYLGKSDLENTDQQYFYAVKDDGSKVVTTGDLIQHTLDSASSLTPGAGTGTYGWYVNLPHSGERVNIHPQLQTGVVTFVTTIPPAPGGDPCLVSGGTGWDYQLAYKTGKSVDGNAIVGTHLDSPPVGMVLLGTENLPGYAGQNSADGRIAIDTGNNSSTVIDIKKPPMTGSSGAATRVQWRELLK